MTNEELRQAAETPFTGIELAGLGDKVTGKVRDAYRVDGKRILITTDRVSAFDRVVGAIPYKGQVLNQLAAWWMERTSDLVDNHLLAVPHPNVAVARDAEPLPVEVVVRGYITGVTKTSLWFLYSQGVEKPYGLDLPAGLRKNDPLPEPAITPTTKGGPTGHDERLTCREVVERGLVDPQLWDQVQRVSLELFARGQERARAAGLVLVDTKYEFGLIDGRLTLIDEVHTPDSSRYWAVGTQEPRDKEALRIWLAETGFNGDGPIPAMPLEKAVEMGALYIGLYEKLTGLRFEPASRPVEQEIVAAVESYLRVAVK